MVSRPRSPFLSSSSLLTLYLRDLMVASGAVGVAEGPAPRAHEVRSVATSVRFLRNWSVAKVLVTATWFSHSVFSNFSFEGCHLYSR